MLDHSHLVDSSIGVGGLLALIVGAQGHCALMCGPIASTVGRPLLYTLGRVVSYAATGAIAGWAGAFARPDPWLSVGFAVLATAAVVFSLVGWPKGFKNRALHTLQIIALRAMGRLRRLGPFALGLGTPLLPCGQLWAVMGFAALSGERLTAAAIGGAFALGSTPGILSFRLVSGVVKKHIVLNDRTRNRWVQTLTTAALIAVMCTASAQFVWTSYRLHHEQSALQNLTQPEPLVCH